MANDRVFIKCKTCGGWKMLLKHYPPTGPAPSDNNILGWLEKHAACHPHRYEMDLKGDPGFTLHTEDDLLIDGCLLPSKQNALPPEVL
jgi:hypothetical protein